MTNYTTPFDVINQGDLPPPEVIKSLSTEETLNHLLSYFRTLAPEYTAITQDDPLYKFVQLSTYILTLKKQEINDASKGLMLAYAKGGDLDHVGFNRGVQRLEFSDGTKESDDAFRERIRISPESYTTAGSEGSYWYWAKSADALVKAIDVHSPKHDLTITKIASDLHGKEIQAIKDYITELFKQLFRVEITVLSHEGDGTATEELLTIVFNAVDADRRRPISDYVVIKSASITYYKIDAELFFYEGFDTNYVLELAKTRLTEYVNQLHTLGHNIPESGIHAALQVTGVKRVASQISVLEGETYVPVTDKDYVFIDRDQAGFCEEMNIVKGSTDE